MERASSKQRHGQFLRKVYTLSRGGRFRHFNAIEVGRDLGLSDEVTRDIYRELSLRGFIEHTDECYYFSVSNAGLSRVEAGLEA